MSCVFPYVLSDGTEQAAEQHPGGANRTRPGRRPSATLCRCAQAQSCLSADVPWSTPASVQMCRGPIVPWSSPASVQMCRGPVLPQCRHVMVQSCLSLDVPWFSPASVQTCRGPVLPQCRCAQAQSCLNGQQVTQRQSEWECHRARGSARQQGMDHGVRAHRHTWG